MNCIVRPFPNPMNFAVIGLSAAMAAAPSAWPARDTATYVTLKEGSTFSYFEYSEKPLTSNSATQEFADGIAGVFASLLQGQEPLGAEFEAVWDANVNVLYES